jgi:hypothetical protein
MYGAVFMQGGDSENNFGRRVMKLENFASLGIGTRASRRSKMGAVSVDLLKRPEVKMRLSKIASREGRAEKRTKNRVIVSHCGQIDIYFIDSISSLLYLFFISTLPSDFLVAAFYSVHFPLISRLYVQHTNKTPFPY